MSFSRKLEGRRSFNMIDGVGLSSSYGSSSRAQSSRMYALRNHILLRWVPNPPCFCSSSRPKRNQTKKRREGKEKRELTLLPPSHHSPCSAPAPSQPEFPSSTSNPSPTLPPVSQPARERGTSDEPRGRTRRVRRRRLRRIRSERRC